MSVVDIKQAGRDIPLLQCFHLTDGAACTVANLDKRLQRGDERQA
jgi:hypothetical protein